MEKVTIKSRPVKHPKRIIAIVFLLLFSFLAVLFARAIYLRSQNAVFRLAYSHEWDTIAQLPPQLQRQALYTSDQHWMGEVSAISYLTLDAGADPSYFMAMETHRDASAEHLTQDIVNTLHLPADATPDFSRPYRFREYTASSGADRLIVFYFSDSEIYLVEWVS